MTPYREIAPRDHSNIHQETILEAEEIAEWWAAGASEAERYMPK
jgi:hypothetical protein